MNEKPLYDNSNTGMLFKIKEPPKTEKHPVYSGIMNVTAPGEYAVKGWVRQSKQTGEKFISFALTPKEKNVERQGSSSFDNLDPPPF